MIGNDDPDPAVINRLIELVESDPDKEVKEDCANCLGMIGKAFASQIVPVLVAALRNHELRHKAIFSLMEFEAAAADAVPELARYFGDEEHEDSVVMALQCIGTDEARKLLRDNGHDEEP